MAEPIKVFGLFKITGAEPAVEKTFLIRVQRPGYSSARQQQEEEAFHLESLKTQLVVQECAKKYFSEDEVTIAHICSFEYSPNGAILHEEKGLKEIEIWMGHPTEFPDSIIISMADSEEEFLKFIESDTDLEFFMPLDKIEKLKVTFVTDSDFDLSEIPKFDINDLQSITKK